MGNMEQELQKFITDITTAARQSRMKDSYQLTLGKLIEQLQSCELTDSEGKPKDIRFDFCRFKPTHLMSWRGSYAELCFGYKDDGDYPTAQSILDECKSAIGQTYEGYKGGDFTMDEDTPVWVANYGDSSDTAIVGVLDIGYDIVILTAHCEY